MLLRGAQNCATYTGSNEDFGGGLTLKLQLKLDKINLKRQCKNEFQVVEKGKIL